MVGPQQLALLLKGRVGRQVCLLAVSHMLPVPLLLLVVLAALLCCRRACMVRLQHLHKMVPRHTSMTPAR